MMRKNLNDTQETVGGRYTLTSAMLIVRQMETSHTRLSVFAEIKDNNKIINAIDRIYMRSGTAVIRRLIVIAYMLKSVVSLDANISGKSRAVAIANYGNEVSTIDRISALLPELEISLMTLARKNLFARGQLRAIGRMILTIPRLWRLVGKIVRNHSFMPACRIASVLPHYMRLGRLMDDNPTLVAAIVASNYSPESGALAAAAHSRNRKVIYANHAQVPCNSPFLPPVLADCSVFYGQAVRDTYLRLSRCNTHATYIGQPGTSVAMTLADNPQTIGIFLTALTRKDRLEQLIQKIKQANPSTRVLIRHHPVSLLKTDLSDLVDNYSDVHATIGEPLADEIAACDLVICGNSSVSLNILGGGRPVGYLPDLDDLPFDYVGFMQNGLLPNIQAWGDTTYAELKLFYSDPKWTDVMTRYDASYGQDVDALRQVAHAEILSHLDL
jgi:hypothetical protein